MFFQKFLLLSEKRVNDVRDTSSEVVTMHVRSYPRIRLPDNTYLRCPLFDDRISSWSSTSFYTLPGEIQMFITDGVQSKQQLEEIDKLSQRIIDQMPEISQSDS